MAKQIWKPGNMIYPLPAVMVSITDGEGNDNIITVAWTGTVCTNPAMAYISVRPSRYSYDIDVYKRQQPMCIGTVKKMLDDAMTRAQSGLFKRSKKRVDRDGYTVLLEKDFS